MTTLRWRKAVKGEASPAPLFEYLLPYLLGLIAIAALAYGASVLGSHDADISSCTNLADEHARLSCYDRLSVHSAPAKGGISPLQFHQ